MTINPKISVREAEGGDAEGIAAVHHAAVHNAGGETYPPDALNHWSGPLNQQRIDDWHRRIQDDAEPFVVRARM